MSDKQWFELKLPDEFVRTLNRQSYGQAMQWLRSCRREILKELPYERAMDKLSEALMYGYTVL